MAAQTLATATPTGRDTLQVAQSARHPQASQVRGAAKPIVRTAGKRDAAAMCFLLATPSQGRRLGERLGFRAGGDIAMDQVIGAVGLATPGYFRIQPPPAGR
jgi:hypothetical protein